MLRRIVLTLILLPISVAVILLAVANRHSVALLLDPFAGDAGMSVQVPLFLVVFGALIVGVVLGGVSVWVNQGRYRRSARRSQREARRAADEVEELRAAAARANPSSKPAGLSLASGTGTTALGYRRDAA